MISPLTSLIVTFGLTVILESLIQWLWTADFRRLEWPYTKISLRLGTLFVSLTGLMGFVAAAVLTPEQVLGTCSACHVAGGSAPVDKARESAPGTGDEPVRAPDETSTSRDLRSKENTVGGFGLRRKARLVPIGVLSLERKPKPHGHEKIRKHPASAG